MLKQESGGEGGGETVAESAVSTTVGPSPQQTGDTKGAGALVMMRPLHSDQVANARLMLMVDILGRAGGNAIQRGFLEWRIKCRADRAGGLIGQKHAKILMRSLSAWLQGYVRSNFLAYKANWFAFLGEERERRRGIKMLQNIYIMAEWLRFTVRGAVGQWKLNFTAWKSNLGANQLAMKMLMRAMSEWLRGTLRGALSQFIINWLDQKAGEGSKELALKMLGMLLGEWLRGTVRGALNQYKLNWRQGKAHRRAQRLVMMLMGKVLGVWLEGTQRGAFWQYKLNWLADRNNREKKELALKLLARTTLSEWMRGTGRGAFSQYKLNYQSARSQGQGKEFALKLISRLLGEWLRGTIRGAYYQYRLNWQHGKAKLKATSLALGVLSRVLAAWCSGSVRGVWLQFKLNYVRYLEWSHDISSAKCECQTEDGELARTKRALTRAEERLVKLGERLSRSSNDLEALGVAKYLVEKCLAQEQVITAHLRDQLAAALAALNSHRQDLTAHKEAAQDLSSQLDEVHAAVREAELENSELSRHNGKHDQNLNRLRADHSDQIFNLEKDKRRLEKEKTVLLAELEALRLLSPSQEEEVLPFEGDVEFGARDKEEPISFIQAFNAVLARCITFQPVKEPAGKLVGMLIDLNDDLVRGLPPLDHKSLSKMQIIFDKWNRQLAEMIDLYKKLKKEFMLKPVVLWEYNYPPHSSTWIRLSREKSAEIETALRHGDEYVDYFFKPHFAREEINIRIFVLGQSLVNQETGDPFPLRRRQPLTVFHTVDIGPLIPVDKDTNERLEVAPIPDAPLPGEGA